MEPNGGMDSRIYFYAVNVYSRRVRQPWFYDGFSESVLGSLLAIGVEQNSLTHWGRNKMATIFRRHFQMDFLE